MTEPIEQPAQPAVEKTAPTCYRHPHRETWVSCGRCGKPLCPDCMQHGPVGVRCAECLRPAGSAEQSVEPAQVTRAVRVALAQAPAWAVVLVISGLIGGQVTDVFAPNFLVAAIAGGMIGWSIWRVCGRLWNRTTIRWAVLIGAVPSLLALLITALYLAWSQRPIIWDLWIVLRALAAIGAGGVFAWLLASQRYSKQ